jgi:hypothetical protein
MTALHPRTVVAAEALRRNLQLKFIAQAIDETLATKIEQSL